MKHVFLIGDSIRMGYASAVGKLLEDVAAVESPEENCRFTTNTLCFLNTWAEQLTTVPAEDVQIGRAHV